MHKNFRWENVLENTHLQDQEGDKWVELVQGRVQW
jgi:hypothetical protein